MINGERLRKNIKPKAKNFIFTQHKINQMKHADLAAIISYEMGLKEEFNVDAIIKHCMDFKSENNTLLPDDVILVSCMANYTNVEVVKKLIRKRDHVRTRWFVYHYFNKQKKWSLQKTGDIFGQDHSTVLHALNSFQQDLDSKYAPTVLAWERFKDLI